MAELAPLRAFRYANESSLPDVVAPPYDVIGPDERARLGARSPQNIVHLDLPEGEGDAKYDNASKLLQRWIDQGVLKRDERPMLLRYEQVFQPPGGGAPITRRGFFALVRAVPYEDRVVLPHERTLSGPKEDRFKLFTATRAALSPVFLLYTDPSGATRDVLEGAEPFATFSTDDGIEHRLARVEDAAAIARVAEALRERQLLIADGHHRYETTVSYGAAIDEGRRAAGLPAKKNGAHRFVMAFLADADDPGLVVFPTHRLVHGLAEFDGEGMLEQAADLFEARPAHSLDPQALTKELADAGKRGPTIAAVLPDGEAHILTLRSDVDLSKHPVLGQRPEVLRDVDVVLLHAGILEHILGITPERQAAQTNLRYLKSTPEALACIARAEGQALFLMNPTPVDQVRRVCESGEVMPQKSTYFYPKVLTGLVVHVLDPEDEVSVSSR